MNYKQLLDKYKSSKMFGEIVNLVLVIFDARPAMLFESANYDADQKKKFFSICKEIDTIKHSDDNFKLTRRLYFLKDGPVHEMLIEEPDRINDDNYLGLFLGFSCVGHMYNNYKKDRIAVHYNVSPEKDKTIKTDIITEVCEFRENAVHELQKLTAKTNKKLNQVLNQFSYVSNVEIKIIYGHNLRYKQLKNENLKYMRDNLEKYSDDFEDLYLDKEFFNKSVTYNQLLNVNKNNINFIKQIYHLAIIKEHFLPLFESAITKEDYKRIYRDILKKDSDWWENKIQRIAKSIK